MHNPDFNRVQFEAVKNEAGLNRFVMTSTKWITRMRAYWRKKGVWNMEKNDRLRRKHPGEETMRAHERGGVLYFTFPLLDRVGDRFVHCFSSRLGGVSSASHLSSMNFSVSCGDTRENVQENFRRIAAAAGFDAGRIVCSAQTHTKHVRVMTEQDAGKGYDREQDYRDVDGMVTNVPGLVLATFYADCVPLYFIDPVHEAVGLSHSGWRGTVADIAGETVRTMQEAYGTRPKELLAAVGPSICQDCYEVSEDVIAQFREQYPKDVWPELFEEKENGKYQLNLWAACRRNLLGAGVLSEHIQVTDLCTCCNPGILFSHRATKGKRGNLGGFLGVRG